MKHRNTVATKPKFGQGQPVQVVAGCNLEEDAHFGISKHSCKRCNPKKYSQGVAREVEVAARSIEVVAAHLRMAEPFG